MLIIEILFIFLLYSLYKKYNFSDFTLREVKYKWLLIIPFALEFLIKYIYEFSPFNLHVYEINVIIMAIFILFLILNIRLKGFILIIIGQLFNLLAIIFNGGRMPVSGKALDIAGLDSLKMALEADLSYTHAIFNSETNLKFLTDIIPTPEWYIFPKIISIGDIFITLGLIMFLVFKIEGADSK